MTFAEFLEMCRADGMSMQEAEDAWFDDMRDDWDAWDEDYI